MSNERKIVERIPVKGEEFLSINNEGFQYERQNKYEIVFWDDHTVSWQLMGEPTDTLEDEMYHEAYERQTDEIQYKRPWQ